MTDKTDEIYAGHDHEIVKCSCGVILLQCRCPNPHKKVRIVVNGCEKCREKAASSSEPMREDEPHAR